MDFQDLDAFVSHLQGLKPTLEHAQQLALHHVADHMKEEIKATYGHQQEKWPALAEATKADRQRKGYPADEPLLRSGELRNSWHYKTGVHSGVIGSDSKLAPIHENGNGHIPARPIMSMVAMRRSEMAAMTVAKAIAQALGGSPVSLGDSKKGI